MNFNETPARRPGGLRFSSRRPKGLVDIEATLGHQESAPHVTTQAVAGNPIAALYVAIARRVLRAVETIEDLRAEAGAARQPSASPKRAELRN
jgi:hypothetical protein